MKNVVLIVDDDTINRMILMNILSDDYCVIEAENGYEALQILDAHEGRVDAIILDLIMPVMDGFEFLIQCGESEKHNDIPIIVSTVAGNPEHESHCLELGAWDFIRKPYNAKIIRYRLKNALERSQLQLMKKLQYMESYDALTGLYCRDRFQRETRRLLDEYPQKNFVLVRLDIAKFQLVNSFFGIPQGDGFIKKIADMIKEYFSQNPYATYGRMRADVFAMCMEYQDKRELENMAGLFREKVRKIIPEFDMIPVFGFYLVTDPKMEVNAMYDFAKMASKQCKGSYIQNFAYYEDAMGQDVINEQKIVNMTRPALEQEKFVLYIQPKYDIQGDRIAGGEVLVRWKESDRGMISPGEFIPVFERNGFIMQLDYYVWEHACKLLRGWLDKGYTPMPISVNVSRVSVYNPNLVDLICSLVESYQIPPELFQLELTESAYTTNPFLIRETMKKLQERGFTILMDDFGSGYSSLNVLKDIAVDVLKIDMKFMEEAEIPGRSENILASVVSMAQRLKMPVIAEGVEKKSQVDFLKGIGCEYVQGFYFAKPMPSEEYEQLAFCAS
ncbi:MAG: EAL domain-containing protein [Eubacteriales bacterium]|nr:EAL domain-containing protein [Eubacteriales bacterium]